MGQLTPINRSQIELLATMCVWERVLRSRIHPTLALTHSTNRHTQSVRAHISALFLCILFAPPIPAYGFPTMWLFLAEREVHAHEHNDAKRDKRRKKGDAQKRDNDNQINRSEHVVCLQKAVQSTDEWIVIDSRWYTRFFFLFATP